VLAGTVCFASEPEPELGTLERGGFAMKDRNQKVVTSEALRPLSSLCKRCSASKSTWLLARPSWKDHCKGQDTWSQYPSRSPSIKASSEYHSTPSAHHITTKSNIKRRRKTTKTHTHIIHQSPLWLVDLPQHLLLRRRPSSLKVPSSIR